MPRIIDISQTLHQGIAVWPGDPPFRTFWIAQMSQGDHCNVGGVTMSLHTGTHADAPRHFHADGPAVDAELAPFIGEALLVDCSGARTISETHLDRLPAHIPPRLLLRTASCEPDRWSEDYAYLAPGAAEWLVRRGIVLLGLDTPSVDPHGSTSLDAHRILARGGVSVLENLSLADAAPGTYELIALPLKLAGMDASPVRAVLRTLD